MTPLPPRRWTGELVRRMRYRFWLKLIGTSTWTTLFFVGYFHTLRHPVHAPWVMPLTVLDHRVPFEPWALPVYLSLWFYVGIAPGLQRTLAETLAYGAWVGALLLAGLVLFFLFPTTVPPADVDTAGTPGFAMLQGVDAAGNACPSMHVAIALFTALWIESIFRTIGAPAWARLLNAAWCLAIAWSTLATRQHVAIDVLLGALLGAAFAWPSIACRPGGAPARRMRPDIIENLPADLAP